MSYNHVQKQGPEVKSKWATMLSYMSVRKKFEFVEETEMKRILTTFDLTLLGIGSMLGMGVYIMSGSLAKTVGPAMLISFILAGFTCVLSAFCYAEFAGRAPGTGSAYAYCYITIGEFLAFLLGWNLVLEFVIGTACLARGLSGYIDSLADNKISKTLREAMPMDISFFSPFPDFFSFAIMVVFSGIISFGVRESSIVNNLVVIINLTTIAILVVIGIIYANPKNWAVNPAEVKDKNYDVGSGGFVPFGGGKILSGAATAFYAYTGFDTVATTGNEAKNPGRAIPIALISSLTTALVVYSCVSCTFTLMWPYYDQDTSAPYPYVLKGLGIPYMKWVVTIGAIAAVTGSTLASIFGMARIVYSIAYDGLLFGYLGKINKRFKTPLNSCMVSGVFTGLLAIIFDTDQLVAMTSLGTLMAYTLVAICIILLRYEPVAQNETQNQERRLSDTGRAYASTMSLQALLNSNNQDRANSISFDIAYWCVCIYVVATFCLNIILAVFIDELSDGNVAACIFAVIFGLAMFATFVVLQRQPTERAELIIKVKPVPLLPLLTVFVNTNLMLHLEWETWVRFIIWLIVGLVIYFTYGIRHSVERPQKTS